MPRRPRARGRIARGVASRARRARPPASSRAKSATAFADAFSRYASFPDRAQAQLRSKSTAALRATKPVVVAKAAFRVNAAAVRLPTRFPRFASREDARDQGPESTDRSEASDFSRGAHPAARPDNFFLNSIPDPPRPSSLSLPRLSSSRPPHQDADTLTKVRTIISEQLGTDLDAVAADAKFVDLGADSLDTVEIMMALEEQFEITLDEEGAEKIATVQEAADMIQDQMK